MVLFRLAHAGTVVRHALTSYRPAHALTICPSCIYELPAGTCAGRPGRACTSRDRAACGAVFPRSSVMFGLPRRVVLLKRWCGRPERLRRAVARAPDARAVRRVAPG